MKPKGLLLLLFTICWLPTGAQNPYFQQFGTEQGLPSMEVYDVAFDQQGRAWFPTDRGLTVYNGYEFETYDTERGLTNNTVLDIKTDPKGQLWFLTLDGKLSYLQRDSIYPFPANDTLASLNRGNWLIQGMAWDDKNRMVFWYQDGIFQPENYFRWDSNLGELERFDFLHLAEDYLNLNLPEFQYLDLNSQQIPEQNYRDFIVLPNGDFCYSPNREKGDLVFGNGKDLSPKRSLSLGKYIHSIFKDEDDLLWVCTSQGLTRFESPWGSGRIKTFFPNIAVSSTTQDREGNYWITTLNHGVRRVPSFNFDYPLSFSGQEENQAILSIYPLKNHLVAGTIKGEIFAIDTNFQTQLIYQDPADFGMFYAPSPVPGGALFSKNIIVEEEKVEVYELPVPHENHQIVYRGQDEYLFLGPSTHWKINLSGSSTPKKSPSANNPAGQPLCFLKTDSCIWIGSAGGVFQLWLDREFDQIRPVDFGNEIADQRVNDLKGSSTGTLFAATIRNGLVVIDGDSIYQFGVEDGLASNMINQIILEDDKTAWLGTNNGIDRIVFDTDRDFKIVQSAHFDVHDGLPNNFIRDLAFWRGYIWVSSDQGVTYFDPERLLARPSYSPSVDLTTIRINQRKVQPGPAPVWSYDENNLTLDFQAVSFSKPVGLPFYRYRLLPRDSTWNLTDNRRVQYMGLPDGDFTFEVSARNNQGQWNETPTQFSFEIRPHFSQTWWFNLTVGLGGFLILGGIIAYRYRQLKLKEIQNRNLQEARIKAKDAELAALRNQMNPHFVFNALNSIQTFIFKNDVPQASYYLGRFAQLMRDGLEFSMHKFITLEKELAFLRAYLELETLRFPGKFTHEISLPDDLDPEEIKLPPFLFQPILENAVKHGFNKIDYPGVLEVRIEQDISGQLTVKILDNGSGLGSKHLGERQKLLYQSRGLMIVRNQVEIINNNQGKASFILRNREDEKGVEAVFTFDL